MFGEWKIYCKFKKKNVRYRTRVIAKYTFSKIYFQDFLYFFFHF